MRLLSRFPSATAGGTATCSAVTPASAAHSARFSGDNIRRSEFIYGLGYQGPGAQTTMGRFSRDLGLAAGQRVADLGCGTGGPSRFLANTYGVSVVAVDVQEAMVSECLRRQEADGLAGAGQVEFRCGSMTDATLFPSSSLDLVWTRDAMMYLNAAQKAQAIGAFAHWLKTGGRFMIGDFGRADASLSAPFLHYCESTHIHPLTSDVYVQQLEAGGKLVVDLVEDHTQAWIELNQRDLDAFEKRRDEFEQRWPGPYFEDLRERWKVKIAAAEDGSFRWQRFVGRKAA